jgi:competence protein ComEC
MSAPGWKTPVDLRVLALGLLFGILGVYALPRLLPWPAFLLPIPLLLMRWPGRLWLASVLLGAMLATVQADARLKSRLSHSEQSQDLWLSGEIGNLPERQGHDWRFIFVPDKPPVVGSLRRVRATWYRSDAHLRAGQCWRLQLRLKSPHGLMNPGGFDYEAWLFREGIDATGYVRDAEPCTVDSPRGLGATQHRLLQLRQSLVESVTRLLPDHAMRGFVLGLTVGDASAISDEQWRILRRTGTTHLVSISGLHITLAAGFVFFLARWLWACWPALCLRLPAQRAAAGIAALSAIAYALLAGFSIPTQRSLAMLLVVMGALMSCRQLVPSRLMALALLAVLLLDSSAVLHPGFWLSFGAVAWMVYSLASRVGPVPRWQTWLQPQWVLALALVPLCLFWFGESSLVSPLANAVMIPLFSLLIPWLLVSVALLDTEWGVWMLWSGAETLQQLWQGLDWLAALPGAYWTWMPPSLPALILAMLGILLALAPQGFPARSVGVVLCLPLFWMPRPAPPSGHVDLTLLDVGQGLAVVVQTRHHVLLFDAGPAFAGGLNSGEAVVLPFLRQQGIRRLDRLVLSHDHADHSGGIQAVREGFNIDEEIGTDRGMPCRAGDRWLWDGVQFEFLHPDESHWPINEGSCVLRVRAGTHSMLLTGDIEAAAEAHLLQTSSEKLVADVIVVPHHGSRSSSTADFVAAVSPRYALVPAGWANRWGFPKTEVRERYEAAGAQVEVTGTHGALQLHVSPERGVERLTRWREQSRRLWRAG